MKYEERLVNVSNKLCDNNNMYSIVLLSAESLTITLSGYRCYLDGKYIVCLNSADKLSVHSGRFEAVNLSFQPYFYNVNLNHQILGALFYDEMREKYGYPDFRLFRVRDNDYFGIIHISDEEYKTASLYFDQSKRDIASHKDDGLWSCRTRSDIISILRIAEGAYLGKQSGLENEILRYIYDNINLNITLEALCSKFNTNRTSLAQLIKEKTGMSPMKFILETRLVQSCPDLLFTRLPINEIAEKYGFSDSNYYIRAFKKRFLKTPLQYRKEGWEARIRDEEIYHRRAEKEINEMTVSEFIDYYNKGLGRAIVKLKLQKDKAPFKQAFLELILRNDHRATDIYEKAIIDIFDDAEFAKEIEARLLNEVSENLKTKHIPLLLLLGKRNVLEEIIENHYKNSYTALLEYTKQPWDGERYPECAKAFMAASGALGKYLKVGDKRIKEILFDIADLYKYAEYPVVPTYQNPVFYLWDGVGREHFFLILDEVIQEHKHGKKLDVRQEITLNPDIKKDDRTLAEVVFSQNRLDADVINHWLAQKGNDKESIVKIARAAVEEDDIERKTYLLSFFNISNDEYTAPEPFPLDVAPLIECMEKDNYRISDDSRVAITETVLQILQYRRQSIVRKIGLKMFFDERFANGRGRFYAIALRFGVNYVPNEDKADFIALMRSPNEEDRNNAIHIFERNIRLGIEDLPLEMIPHVFANIVPYWKRHSFCEMLVEKSLMPEDLKEECLYDYNNRTRELFLKTQKPKAERFKVFLKPPEKPSAE